MVLVAVHFATFFLLLLLLSGKPTYEADAAVVDL